MQVIIKAGIILAAVSAASCCGAALYSRRRARRKGLRAKESEAAARAVVADGIRKYASEFDGLYESLYQAEQNRQLFTTEAYEEWCGRVEQLENTEFKSAFRGLFDRSDIEDETRCRAKFSLLLNCIALAGIARDRDSKLCCVADESLQQAYLEMGNKKPQLGDTYTVIKAAWLNDERVIEYGLVMPGSLEL